MLHGYKNVSIKYYEKLIQLMLKAKCMSFPSLLSSIFNFPETVFVLKKTVPKRVEIHYLIRAVQAAQTASHITSGMNHMNTITKNFS